MAVWLQALAAFALIVIALLAVPLDLRCRADSHADDKWRLQARWLLGLVRIERSSSHPRKKPQRPARAARERRRRGGGMPSFVRSPAFFRRGYALTRTLLRRIRIWRFDLQLRVGLDDPADTGRLMGVLQPLCVWIRPHLPGPFLVMPDFEETAFELRGETEVRLVPLRFVGPLMAFGAWMALQAWKARRR